MSKYQHLKPCLCLYIALKTNIRMHISVNCICCRGSSDASFALGHVPYMYVRIKTETTPQVHQRSNHSQGTHREKDTSTWMDLSGNQ